jgi:prohibitin 2
MAKYRDAFDAMPPPPQKVRGWRLIWRHLPGLSVLVMVSLLTVVVLWPYVVITVPSGRVGVLWKRFNGFDLYCWCFVGRGTILDPRELREEGLHIIWPWDRLFIYDLRLQSESQTYNAISKDGVSVASQINIRFQLLHNSVAVLHKFIGPDYFDTVVSPEIGSQAREIISQYTAQQVYTSREEIQDKIRQNAQKSLGANLNKLVQPEAMEQPDPKHYNDFLQNSIQILDTLVLSIVLPPEIVAAINRQTEEFYEIQEYKFRVEKEAEESKRKQIEADGIAAFQRTVSQGISDSYLRWRGIEATLALAQSPNTKIVIVGSGKDGLPIILGNVDNSTVSVPPPQPGTSATPPPSGASAPGQSPQSPSSTNPVAPPNSGGTSATPPNGTTPPATDKKSDATEAPEAPNQPERSSIEMPDIGAAISRFTSALRPSGSAPSSAPTAAPKQ